MTYKVKAKRVELGISQNTFASMLGITPQYLWKVEKGLVEPRRDLMLKIAEVLNADVIELFFEDFI